MKNVLRHNGYVARIEFDSDDRIFVGRIAGIEDGVSFHSDTVEGLITAFQEALSDYIETCAKVGKQPEKPFSGKVFLRVDPATHAKATIAAKLAGKSLNQFGEEALERAADQLLPT
ncbi:MAG: type II toxin-antitoxin system HicB family antitoxin [Pseudomonadota bacterium]|nr:type II toxin-antitoxin system HicB family antitoxin [Pseudomonadota bacterium]